MCKRKRYERLELYIILLIIGVFSIVGLWRSRVGSWRADQNPQKPNADVLEARHSNLPGVEEYRVVFDQYFFNEYDEVKFKDGLTSLSLLGNSNAQYNLACLYYDDEHLTSASYWLAEARKSAEAHGLDDLLVSIESFELRINKTKRTSAY